MKQFQNDPRVRVALLSTTAAGVAITLTASSCVWFAELYYTPGLLIQAEDRCHRIGQKEDVTVNYFVAHDTLDDGKVQQNRNETHPSEIGLAYRLSSHLLIVFYILLSQCYGSSRSESSLRLAK